MSSRFILLLILLSTSGPIAAQVARPSQDSTSPADVKAMAGDPFLVSTGIYLRECQDLFVKDTIPIDFVRTQRNMDARSRSFGVGASTSYDTFIVGDVKTFTWVALVNADGSQERYIRTSPGTGYADGVFEDPITPDKFLGSRISWNGHGGWIVKLRSGTEYTIQGCSATSKPGQCGVLEMRNAQGDRLTVQRDKDGNILRITSPHGHYVALTNDASGRIIRAEDDEKRWVKYTYDDQGCLVEVTNWRGDRQRFRYDSHFNMTFVHEKGPRGKHSTAYNFTVTNHYDEHDRLHWQRVNTGEVYKAKYHTEVQGHIYETEIQGPSGSTRHLFDQLGYVRREEFRAGERLRWTLARRLDPETNELRTLVLTCGALKIRLPTALDAALDRMGEGYKPFLSEVCRRAEHSSRSDAETSALIRPPQREP